MSCLDGLPRINWGAVNRENARAKAETYWCVVHYETRKVWRRTVCWDQTKWWDMCSPIKGWDNAVRRLNCMASGDRGLWKLRQVYENELEVQ